MGQVKYRRYDIIPKEDHISIHQQQSPPPPASSNRNTIRKVPPPLPPRLSKAQLERSKHHNTGTSHKGKTNPTPTKSFAQVASAAANILQIKEAFPTLPNKKIMEIHNAAFDKPAQRTKKIQITTKGSSRKQAIVPLLDKHTETIMTDASSHVHLINNLLKNIKSSTRAEYIQPCPGGLSIATNNVPAPSDLTLIERYIKSIDGINNDEVLTPCLPQSKSYLEIPTYNLTATNSLARTSSTS